MTFNLENILLAGSVLLIVSIIASKSTRWGIPSLLLFLLVGMLAGSEGLGGIVFDDYAISRFIGNVALVLILFSGGLDTRFTDIKPILRRGILLSTLGVLLTALLVGAFVHLITPMEWLECFLLGAIISSTDAASVFAILRLKKSGLKGHIRPMLEFESGSNDPMAFFLTIFFIFFLQTPDQSIAGALWLFVQQFTLGAAAGVALGFLMLKLINRINLDFEGLYSVMFLSLAMFVFSFTTFIGGNGFLAVYISAMIMGNKDFIHKRSLIKHFDGQAWFMQIMMFLALGLLVFPSQLWPHTALGLLVFGFLLLVARPTAVFLLLYRSRFNFKAKLFISWVGLRGAVPIVLAIYALDAQTPNAGFIFNLVFFISVLSVAIQGTTIPWIAKRLRLSIPVTHRKKSKVDIELANKVKSIHLELDVHENSFCNGKSVVEMEIPSGVTLNLIERDGMYLVPDGKTIFKVGDRISVIADGVDALQQFSAQMGTNL